MKSILIIIMAVLCFACTTGESTKVTGVVKSDTVYVHRIVRDTLTLISKPEIRIIDTNRISIQPYLAVLDSVMKIANREVRVRTTYSVPDNIYQLRVDELKVDSIPVVTQTHTETITKEVARSISTLEWVLAGCLVLSSFFIGFIVSELK